jgi:2-oxoglutarate ferredoxin oxidoreductase subunit alpha
MKQKHYKNEVTLVLGGSAGQGLQTIEKVISLFFRKKGYHIFSSSEYMSRVRGGSNSTEIRVSDFPTGGAFKKNIDIAFCLDCESKRRLSDRWYEKTLVIADKSCEAEKEEDGVDTIFIPLVESAQEIGGKIYTNTLIAGIILALFDIDDAGFKSYLKEIFLSKGEKVVENNIHAAEKGKVLGEEVKKNANIILDIQQRTKKEKALFVDGSQGIAFGALAGGCNFVASYPMSPSTGVLTLLAEYSKDLDIAVEQVEDEITAIHMAIGAWYAGARALVTTSGGGFALMAEALSLAGMTESPVVIHLAQRPGPATGLPTRTEQGDLEFALYGGHGTFPRIILTPGTPEECFVAMKQAMYLADKYQVPVIVMTDQFLLDSFYETNLKEMSSSLKSKPQKFFIETDEKYKRYRFTDDGLSPRGIPGFGKGFVHVDSDEHDEDGRIIEDAPTRVMMMEKRQYRLELAREEALEVLYCGSDNPTFLIVGWGSSHGAILEVLKNINNKHVGYLHITQVFPLGSDVRERIENAKQIIVVENNMTGQFANLLEKECKIRVSARVNRYDGWPFSVEELQEELEELIA